MFIGVVVVVKSFPGLFVTLKMFLPITRSPKIYVHSI